MNEEEIYEMILNEDVEKYPLLNEIFAIRDNRHKVNNYTICVNGYISLDVINKAIKLQKENELTKQALIKNCNIADERNQLLKENEKLKNKLLDTLEGQKVIEEETTQYIKENYIPKQKIKDIIDRIDYDIEKTKEIISKNTSVYATYRKNDYQIVRLRAMNTKSLDIKKLLESEK